MNIYSIPPLLTLGGFLSLAVFAACRGAQTVTGKLFVGICTLGVCLYTDILLAFNLNDPAIALRISRLDHFFIVYLIPLYLHFFPPLSQHLRKRLVGKRRLCICRDTDVPNTDITLYRRDAGTFFRPVCQGRPALPGIRHLEAWRSLSTC